MANSPSVSLPAPSSARTKAISITNGTKWLIATVLIVALLYYLIGVDEGAYSIFGKSMFIHEFVHDARHFLGFPCH
jgi:Probable cobalt transporter subunit (CbtB)